MNKFSIFSMLIIQAIVNEDASGDVLAMRIQIQNLKVKKTWRHPTHHDIKSQLFNSCFFGD